MNNSFAELIQITLIRPAIVPALTHIINLSLSTGNFPQTWKNAKIIPLHKKDDKLNPKNYHPVAILPVFSKVLERVVFNQIVQYLSSNNLLHPSHHAYRSNHNTTTALIQMYDAIQQWNDLPFKIRNLSNPLEFKKHVKKLIKENLPIG